MALNLTEGVIRKENSRVNYEDNRFFTDIKQWSYNRIYEALQVNSFPHKKTEEFISVKLTEYSDEVEMFQTFYNLQLLGYMPIIVEIEKNMFLKRKISLIHQLILKGALVHVDALSLIGENGKEAKKYALNLCKRGYVHLVTANESDRKKGVSISEQADNYLKQKTSEKYVNYLKENKRNVYLGKSFHILNIEDEQGGDGLGKMSSLVKSILRR